jgi:hypothetical protein
MKHKLEMEDEMFRITSKKGFHITFENGYTVSVQFGPGNYCDNYDRNIGIDEERCGKDGSTNAECAVWANDGELIKYPSWNDTVSNRSTPDEVLSLMNWASSQKRGME